MTKILLILLLIASPSPKEWKAAVSRVEQEGSKWAELFSELEADPRECQAIVFPEILRYNRFVDKVQTGILLGRYVREGKESSNFSIGIFQMKPSFVEEIEQAWMSSSLSEQYQIYFDTSERETARHKRIRRIENEEWQCRYIAIFYRLMLEREPSLQAKRPEQRLRYLATAYNYSFTATLPQLEARMKVKTFHLDILRFPRTKLYSYCELSLKRYRQLSK